MAQNIRAKIPEGNVMTIFDVNANSMKKFTEDAGPKVKVQIASSPREVAEKSVSAVGS